MSVEDFSQLGGALAFLGEDTPEHCFLCGKPLAGITTYWHGAGGQSLALHPECGERLGGRLIRDSLNAKYLAEGKSVTAGVGVGLVPADTS